MKTVSVTVDYSNGSQKSFTAVRWTEGFTILEALEAAKKVSPGLAINFGSSRNGSVIGLTLDGVPEKGQPGEWSTWINQRRGPKRLGTATSFGFDPQSRAVNEVQPGEHILVKLETPPAEGT